MSRRDFFPIIGSGIGAVVGGMVAKQETPKPQAGPIRSDQEAAHSGEECEGGGKIDS